VFVCIGLVNFMNTPHLPGRGKRSKKEQSKIKSRDKKSGNKIGMQKGMTEWTVGGPFNRKGKRGKCLVV
jgi:hypothetical protein